MTEVAGQAREAPDPPRVLAIAGSPRRGGNTDLLLDACVEGVAHAGGTASRLVVSELRIAPCKGCNSCAGTGSCIQHDDMDEVYVRLDEADAIVVATPVYFATVPSGLKALYDRCQPYWVRRFVLGEPAPRRRHGAILLAGGGGDPFGSECAATTTASVFGVLGLRIDHRVDVRDADRAGEIARHPEAIAEARRIGGALAGVTPA